MERATVDLCRSLFDAAPSLRGVELTPEGARLVLVRPVEPVEIDAMWEALGELGRLGAHGYR